MGKSLVKAGANLGTLPVFMTAISTILGAILFLRFGFAVANVGLIGTLLIILVGHLVTIPTAMAVAEIATNQKVEGGGAYFMISRSFGLNIGAAIGVALFASQAISVAFYVIAFAESFESVLPWLHDTYGLLVTKQHIGLVMMAFLSLLMMAKGANVGLKALYVVVAVLFVAIGMFIFGDAYSPSSGDLFATIEKPKSFFYYFTIIFPAFTGIAAGLGLSGDLKDPKKAIPQGTMWATAVGILIYVVVAFKLFYSASLEDLGSDQLIMSKIAIWPPIIPIGLACAAVSSALGSVMIAPRTLQALGVDKIFPDNMSGWFARARKRDGEPFNSTIVTCIIAFAFVLINDIDVVAQIISMFFMVTYGAICSISFLEYFAADPSYRPTFKSKWYVSLMGALLCFYLMFKMNMMYAYISLGIMLVIYLVVTRIKKTQAGGIANLFKGLIFQVSRELQVYLQHRATDTDQDNWRPFIISVSKDSFKRRTSFDMTRWLSHKYGFGTYIHFIEGFLSKETYEQSNSSKKRLIELAEGVNSRVYLDTIISPSFTSAIAQVIQFSGVSGKGNNLLLFEYSEVDASGLEDVKNNYNLLKATQFDVCVLRTTLKGFGYNKEIHLWISPFDEANPNLMVLLAYIILGHPDWKKAEIKIFSIYKDDLEDQKSRLNKMIRTGRLPISPSNIELIPQPNDRNLKEVINDYSSDASLTIIGFRTERFESDDELFDGYTDLGNVLFVNSMGQVSLFDKDE